MSNIINSFVAQEWSFALIRIIQDGELELVLIMRARHCAKHYIIVILGRHSVQIKPLVLLGFQYPGAPFSRVTTTTTYYCYVPVVCAEGQRGDTSPWQDGERPRIVRALDGVIGHWVEGEVQAAVLQHGLRDDARAVPRPHAPVEVDVLQMQGN